MRPSAPRVLRWLGFVAIAAVGLSAAEPPTRAKPTRPTSPTPPSGAASKATTASGSAAARAKASSAAPAKPEVAKTREFVGLKDAALRLGLKMTVAANGLVTLADATRRVEFAPESRETRINGLRFFLGDPVTMRGGELQVSRTDFETCLVPLLRPMLMTRVPARPKVIAIDAGHGGADTGTQNPRLGLKEKTFTLDVAQRLKKRLEQRGYKVVMTRETDERVNLQSRAIIANRGGADLFVSIHFNSLFPDTKTSGAEVFTFTRAGQRSDQSRAFGQSDDTEEKPAPINRFDALSVMLADAVHRATLEALKLPDRGQKTKHLGMLRGLNCPGVLVETGFLSNDAEAKKIATAAYRDEIADALTSGIESYAAMVGVLAAKR